jgi:hypothetical protein
VTCIFRQDSYCYIWAAAIACSTPSSGCLISGWQFIKLCIEGIEGWWISGDGPSCIPPKGEWSFENFKGDMGTGDKLN